MINTNNYNYKSWNETYPNHTVNLDLLKIHRDWKPIFEKIKTDPRFKETEEFLTFCLNQTKGKIKIYPYPNLIFQAFNVTPLKQTKVVILGQDPYHQNEMHNNKIIPQAMGMSFSVPQGISIPSSLKNIFNNLISFEHLEKSPSNGNLQSWAEQGVLLLNTSLTVQHGYPNGHSSYWKWMTDIIIKHISDTTTNTVFVLWGSPAYSKKSLIDTNKHLIIASSHPSGLSYSKKMADKPAFKDQDHFKLINDYLTEHNKTPIKWNNIQSIS